MFTRLLFLMAALWGASLFADVQDHLKKVTDKGTGHHMRNIDFIYLINLDKRPEKFASCIEQLNPYGINPYRFSAVFGWGLPLEVINDLGVKYKKGMATNLMGTYYAMDKNGEPTHEIMHVPGRTYFCHTLSRGAIGIAVSHLSILQDAFDSGYTRVWVMEDDIIALKNPHLISDRIDDLNNLVGKKGWDMLFTDQDMIDNRTGVYVPCFSVARRPNFTPEHPHRFAKRVDIGKGFRKIGARYGFHSYIINRSGMKKLLNFIKKYKIFLPIDMDFVLPSDMHIYCVTEDIVSNRKNAISDNGNPELLNKK